MGTLEGVLLKDGGWRKGYRKRYFKMSKVYIQYFENEFCTSPKGAAVRGTIKNVEVSDLELFRFRIIFKSEVWDLEAPSKLDMINWMETIKPKSAASIINASIGRPVVQNSSSPPINTSASTNDTTANAVSTNQIASTGDLKNDNHTYQPLPHSFTVNPRFSVKEGPTTTDGNQFPDASSPRARNTSSSSVRSRSSVASSSPSLTKIPSPQQPVASASPNNYEAPVPEPGVSDPASTPLTTNIPAPLSTLFPAPSQNTSPPTNQESPRHTIFPLNLNLSSDEDDEFLDFDSDVGCYTNDPQGTLDTLRKEVRSLNLTDIKSPDWEKDGGVDTPVNCVPSVSVIQTSPGEYDNEEHEYMNSDSRLGMKLNLKLTSESTDGDGLLGPSDGNADTQSITSDVSPVPLRRAITSQSLDGNHIHYSISIPTLGKNDGPNAPTNKNTRDSSSSFLSVSSTASHAITTLRVQQWIKKVRPAKKEYVDPEDQEVGELDKFLMEKAECLPKDNINLLQKIGNGAFGEVWKAECNPPITGYALVAVKCLKEGLSEKHRHDFYGEAALLGQFRHANVIALHGVILQELSPWIVIEYAEKGALKSFLKQHVRQSHELLNYCRDIVRGMTYLSDRGYIHRDLAARNVLLTQEEVCKIADFGLSRKLGDDDDIYVSRGGMVAIKWTAPEGVLGASYSSASDVWSCGVTMWEVFSKGANPWSGLSNEDAFRNIRRGGRLARPEECPMDVHSLLLRCWSPNPMERITFSELDRELSDSDDHIYQNSEDLITYENLDYRDTPPREK